MIDKLQAFLIFCEDLRVEEGGKPMIIGMLSPVFYVDEEPGVSDVVRLVTFVHAPHDVPDIVLRLEISISNGDSTTKKTLGTKLERPDDTDPDEPWGAFLQYPVEIAEWRNGLRIGATLHANEVIAKSEIRSHFIPSETESKPRKRKSTKRAANSGTVKISAKEKA